MGHDDRARFLEFVTACPHLQQIGLSGVAIEVLPAQPGCRVPTARSCGNQLRLPGYKTAEELRHGLQEAFVNMPAGGVHERDGA